MTRRRLLNFLTAVSLLLCAAAAALWVRSYFRYDTAFVTVGGRYCHLWSGGGTLDFSTAAGCPWDLPPSCVSERPNAPSDPRPFNRVANVSGWTAPAFFADGSLAYPGGPPLFTTEVRVPHWALALGVALLPAARAAAALRRRLRYHTRSARGLCGRCGYDLRASPDRCPECGSGAKTAQVE